MIPATSFIEKHIGKYGVIGSNNLAPDDRPFEQLASPRILFTRDNHFRFGFGDEEFNSRSNSAAIYWTEYGKSTRPHREVLNEVKEAISEVHEIYGRLSVTNSGTGRSRSIIAAAKEIGIAVEQITVEIEGHAVPPHDDGSSHRCHRVPWESFVEFATNFSKTAGCSSPWIALEAYHGHVSDTPHIYTHARLIPQNHNFDFTADRVAGPPNWSIVELEIFTSINRWLLATERPGVPQILNWSPELIAAQLDADLFREGLRKASAGPPTGVSLRTWWNELATQCDVFERAYPGLPKAPNMMAARNDEALNKKMNLLATRLGRLNPGCNSAHYIPLHRLAKSLGVRYDFYFGDTEELYGRICD